MQGNKLTLNIRKPIKKESRNRVMHIKTQKIVVQPQSLKKQAVNQSAQQSSSSPAEVRHKSVFNRNHIQKNGQPRRDNEVIKEPEEQGAKFPEIYRPPNSSVKFFDLKKYQNKFKMGSTNSVMEKRYPEGDLMNHRSVNRKTQLISVHRNAKLNEAQSLKDMTKERKMELFKAIRSEFHELINTTNNLSVKNQDLSFKAYVEKGNNGILVKEIIKKRWWWHVVEDKDKANLVWTEWMDKSAISSLKNISISQQLELIEEYKSRKFIESNKCEAIKKLVDEQTYQIIEKRINLNSNTYFRSPKNIVFGGTSKSQSENVSSLKQMTVTNEQVVHNHVQGCLNLHSKKLLFMNFHKFMQQYLIRYHRKSWDPFEFIPLTFYINSRDSAAVDELMSKFEQYQKLALVNKDCRNVWICKPGENSNRGCGIKVVKSKEDIMNEINTRLPDSRPGNRSVIIQKYIEKCFLIQNRKFDIRCYILLTTANGILKGYWYKDGYIRTSSLEYDLNDIENEMIHLTNDAVQKKGQEFGKHEDSNKLSFDYFRQYLRKIGSSPFKFDEAYEQMKLIAYYLIASVSAKIKRKQFTFELFGLDFMLDANLKPILIEANSNPCLSNHGKILGKLIHELVENVAMTAIDPIFPPPMEGQKKKAEQLNKDYFSTNNFELIFDSKSNLNTTSTQSKETSFHQNFQDADIL